MVALVKVRTVNLTAVALALNPSVKAASNYRRAQRFLAGFEVDFEAVARLMLALLPVKDGSVVTIDRTNWQFGRSAPINVLMLGVAWRGLAFPILWRLLPKTGVSSTGERIALVRRLLRLVEARRIRAVVADREFIGQEWLAFLEEEGLPFVMRIRKNALVGSRSRAKPARIEKLVALLSVAFAWAYLLGDWLDRKVQPIRVKSHGRRAKSVFRYGLDHLRFVVLNIAAKIREFGDCLKVLSCT